MNESDPGLNQYLREIGRIPLLTPQQEVELAAKIKKGDAKAREQMINANLRLVVTIAHDYANLGLPLLDLISEGNIGLTKAVAREYASRGVTVNAVAPGFIDTAMTHGLAGEAREALLKQIPLGRLGTPDDVAQAVRFLVSPAAAYITGHVLHVNGGMLMG